MTTLRKVILTFVLIVSIVAIVNTVFYFWLKSSHVIEIAEKMIRNDPQLIKDIGEVQSVSPLFLSSKKFSWTGRRSKIQFDVLVDGKSRNCIIKFIMEKRDSDWSVKNSELKKCFESEECM